MANLTPMQRIRLKCLDCCADSPKEVRLCPCEDCVLWPVRFGKRPKIDSEPENSGVAKDFSSPGKDATGGVA
jgi:hypothetical protein